MSMPFPEQVAPGGILIYPQIQSPNFNLAAQTGWAIMSNGDAYFFNITAEGSITSNTVVVDGTGDGVFIYSGTPGPGTLILAMSSAAGTDRFGNHYSGPGIAISAPGSGTNNEIQIRPDLSAILIYATT
jgi:hypothetical protein